MVVGIFIFLAAKDCTGGVNNVFIILAMKINAGVVDKHRSQSTVGGGAGMIKIYLGLVAGQLLAYVVEAGF